MLGRLGTALLAGAAVLVTSTDAISQRQTPAVPTAPALAGGRHRRATPTIRSTSSWSRPHARSPAAASSRGATSAHVPPASCSFISTGTRGATPTPPGCASELRAGRGPGGRYDDSPGQRPAGDWSFIDVTAVRLLAGGGAPLTDLTASGTFIAPDDGNKADQTVLSVPLPGAVAPGESVTVELAWTARVPRTFARTGAVGNYFFIAQWFPKLGVLEDTGWNTHQFHAGTEFYADYGVYDVRITVPRGWVVGATGRERERHDTPKGTTTHRYVQEDVHDFVWTTSPDYVVKTATFEHPTLPRTELRLLLQPEHLGQAERHFAATRTALKYYGEWFGPYPYGHLTIVDPAWQSSAGGMEYPTLFTAGTRWLAPAARRGARRRHDPRSRSPVLVRPGGQQRVRTRVAGRRAQPVLDVARAPRGVHAALLLRAVLRRLHPVGLPRSPADARRQRRAGRLSVGGRKRRAGDAVVAVLHRHRRRDHLQQDGAVAAHARTAHRVAAAAAGPVALLRAVAVQASQTRGSVCGAVGGRRTRSDVVLRPGLSIVEHVRLRGGPAHDHARRARAAGSPTAARGDSPTGRARQATWRSEVVVQRLGEAVFPVDVLVRFSDGSTARERWDGRERWKLFTYDRPAAAVSAEVDPNQVLLLDVNRTNNSRTLDAAGPEGQPAVGRPLVGVAAGSGDHVWLLRLRPRT